MNARAWAAEVAADGVLDKPFGLEDLDEVFRLRMPLKSVVLGADYVGRSLG